MEVFLDSPQSVQNNSHNKNKNSSQKNTKQHSRYNSQLDTMRRTLLASFGALLYSLVIFICYQLGYVLIDAVSLIILYLCFWAGHIATVGFVYRRHKQNLNAPSMSLLHMVWAVMFINIILYFTVEIRSALMMAYLTILSFGAFRLHRRGFFGVTLFIIASYAIMLFLFQQNNSESWSPELEIVIGITFLTALLSFCVLGREFSLLRERLANSEKDLVVALSTIEALSIMDELTGVYNRRHLLDHLDKQRALANREGSHFVLAFVNVDRFKAINEKFGCVTGNKILQQFSDLLRESIREVDLVARYDGKKFALLLNGVEIDAAVVVVERIRCIVENMKFLAQNIEITISVGITEYQAPEAAKNLLDRADQLLYQAKQEGHNRVIQDREFENGQQLNLLS